MMVGNPEMVVVTVPAMEMDREMAREVEMEMAREVAMKVGNPGMVVTAMATRETSRIRK